MDGYLLLKTTFCTTGFATDEFLRKKLLKNGFEKKLLRASCLASNKCKSFLSFFVIVKFVGN
jgi:hypothetical protein